jgi:DNA polymerase-3 subunit gamma/tau
MGQALYRKYRPKTLNEIVGQEHISQTLGQAIKTSNISHAYLFSGPKGVGKTSIARILAHEINNLDYDEHKEYLDIIEIDAASNNGIDDIRDLREKAYIAPTSAPYKIYIIDEVHMLSKQAFNALLKTLEEPPAHVIFILATTEINKIPETIISRTQRFQFKLVEQEKVIKQLKKIANLESIKINDQALQLIAMHGQGSFRDSISLLDQASNYVQPITEETINVLIGLPPTKLIDEVIDNLVNANQSSLIRNLNNLFVQGYTAPAIASNLASILRTQLINQRPLISNHATLELLANLIDVDGSNQPESYLEICLLKTITQDTQNPDRETYKTLIEKGNSQSKNSQNLSVQSQDATKDNQKVSDNSQRLDSKTSKKNSQTSTDKLDWDAVLNILKAKYNTLYGVVRMAQVDTTNPLKVKLSFAFAFHQKRVNESKNKEIILDAIRQVSTKDIALECVIDSSLLTKTKHQEKEPDIDTITTIFGNSQTITQ